MQRMKGGLLEGLGLVFLLVATGLPTSGQFIDESCTVSVLNRTARARPDGTWVLPNIPASIGQVRARVTCVQDGVTRSGQSDFLVIPINGSVVVPDISIVEGASELIPETLTLTASSTTLTAIGTTAQLTASATYSDGTTGDLTGAAAGTNYTVSNPAVATVSADGRVTAVASGTVLVTALNEGAPAFLTVRVVLSGDTDGDGIPDDLELANGLDPNNPVDATEDLDDDGLTNEEELVDLGTDLRLADTDGDGISDGEEVAPGKDGFISNPLVVDTDGDGVRDGLEVATGSDPSDPASLNLAEALASLEVTPPSFDLTFNTLFGEVSRQLTVTGNLIDGTTLDLTAAVGTNYDSSDLTVCSFGATPGEVFAGETGTCIVTASNSGFSDDASGAVETFAPTALSFVPIPGFANNVDVDGGFAYVAAGSAGLQVVSVSDPDQPAVVGSAPTPGNADDVKVVGSTAFVADGSAGLQIFDLADPVNPVAIGSVDTPGTAQDVVVVGALALVADGDSGLQVIDVGDLTAPEILGSADTPGTAKGVDLDGGLAVVADGTPGVRGVDLSDPVNPVLLGGVDTGDARDVVVEGAFALVADFSGSFTVVDFSDPANPSVRASTPQGNGGLLQDVAVSGDGLAFGADVFFVNAVPIIDVGVPSTPIPRGILDFRSFGDENGTGIAVNSRFVYLTASNSITENGSTGSTRLYIGQYRALEDTAGIPPTVGITAPLAGEEVIEGTVLPITAEATDDVAVTAVSFLANGVTAFTDTSAPYGFDLTVPFDVSELTLEAIAVDPGSNLGFADPVTINVLPDPGTTAVGSVTGSQGSPVEGATVTCLDVSGLSDATGNFTLPEVPTVQGDVQCTAVLDLGGGESLIGASDAVPPVVEGITDVGRIVVTDIDVSWIGTESGFWDDPANWSTGSVPEPGDRVLLAGPAGVTVTHRQGTTRVDRILGSNPLVITGGSTLDVADTVALDNTLTISRGTLAHARVLPGGPGSQVIVTASDGTLDGVTLDTDVTVQSTGVVTVLDGLTLNGVLTLDSRVFFTDTALHFSGTQTLAGTGEVLFAGTTDRNSVRPTDGGVLTIGSGITLHSGGRGGTVGNASLSLVHRGTIVADAAGRTLAVTGSTVTNQGTFRALRGGTLHVSQLQNFALVEALENSSLVLAGDWSNHNVLTSNGGTVSLGGTFTLAGLGNFTRSGGVVRLTGTLDNRGTVLALNETTGSWEVAGGRIDGGTVTTRDPAQLIVTSAHATWDGVFLQDADVLVQSAGKVTVLNELALDDSVITLDSRVFFTDTALNFSGTQAFLGDGEVLFAGTTNRNVVQPTDGGELTIGPGITIRSGGQPGTVGNASLPLIHQGTISADVADRAIVVRGSPVTNEGTLEAAGGTLELRDTWSNAGTLRLTAGILELDGSFSTADIGTFERTGGVVRVTGTLDNTGALLALDATTGSWEWAGGRIDGGTVATSDGSQLLVTASNATWDGVTLEAGADVLVQSTGKVTVLNGLTHHGTITLDSRVFFTDTALHFSGTQTLSGSGEILFAGTTDRNAVRPTDGGELTLGPDLVLRSAGRGGTIGNPGLSLVHRGRIVSETAGRTLAVTGSTVTHEGTLEAIDGGGLTLTNLQSAATASVTATGGAVTLNGDWTNGGTIQATDSNVALGGTFTLGDLGDFTRSGGVVRLTGTLENGATTLALDAVTGSWQVDGGRIDGGAVSTADGSQLLVTASNATWDGVTLEAGADVVVQSTGKVTVLNGLTHHGTITLESGVFFTDTALHFSGTQTLTGNGEILFGGTTNRNVVQPTDGGELTIGPGITIRSGGQPGTVGNASLPLIHQGTISADVADRAIVVRGSPVTNEGTLEAAGGTLELRDTWSNAGTLRLTAGTLELDGSFSTAGIGTFERSGGVVRVTGTLDNAGALLTLDAVTGSWEWAGGRIDGGTVSTADGSQLLVTASNATWDGVTLEAGADVVVQSTGKVTVLNGLTHHGTITLESGVFFTDTALHFSGTQTLTGTGEILFAGTTDRNAVRPTDGGELTLGPDLILRSAGRGGTIGNAGLNLVNRARIVSETSGRTLAVTGSAVTNEGTMRAASGGVVSVTNLALHAGVLEAGAGGRVTIHGDFVQDLEGAVAVEIGGLDTNAFGRVEVTGAATLNGTLEVQLVNGFEPLLGNSFVILTFASRTGDFADTVGLDLPNGLVFDPVFSPTDLTLEAVSP